MTLTDPRDHRGDLLETESRERVPADEFADAADSEAVESGWVVLGLAFDDAGRVLMIDQSWADGWILPGGARKPGETLAEATVRELREETGVEVSPLAPRAVDEFRFVHDDTGATAGWTLVVFEAVAESTEIDRDPSVDDETIDEIRWFDGLPENAFNSELLEPAYERCERGP
jgi:ADP-ribose pyrophosphatase YjhB (NUDIX family)